MPDKLAPDLLAVVNTVRANKGLPALLAPQPEMRLREDLGFDSLDLAELTARLNERFHVDVFAAGWCSRSADDGRRMIGRKRW